MILGIGVDLCRIARMKDAITSEYFVKRIFAPEEIEYARSQKDPAVHFAGSYAAKEAFGKALGLGVMKMGLRSSWIRRTDHGPVIFCDEGLSEKLEERGVHNLWISLSHEGEYAVAFVVLES